MRHLCNQGRIKLEIWASQMEKFEGQRLSKKSCIESNRVVGRGGDELSECEASGRKDFLPDGVCADDKCVAREEAGVKADVKLVSI